MDYKEALQEAEILFNEADSSQVPADIRLALLDALLLGSPEEVEQAHAILASRFNFRQLAFENLLNVVDDHTHCEQTQKLAALKALSREGFTDHLTNTLVELRAAYESVLNCAHCRANAELIHLAAELLFVAQPSYERYPCELKKYRMDLRPLVVAGQCYFANILALAEHTEDFGQISFLALRILFMQSQLMIDEQKAVLKVLIAACQHGKHMPAFPLLSEMVSKEDASVGFAESLLHNPALKPLAVELLCALSGYTSAEPRALKALMEHPSEAMATRVAATTAYWQTCYPHRRLEFCEYLKQLTVTELLLPLLAWLQTNVRVEDQGNDELLAALLSDNLLGHKEQKVRLTTLKTLGSFVVMSKKTIVLNALNRLSQTEPHTEVVRQIQRLQRQLRAT